MVGEGVVERVEVEVVPSLLLVEVEVVPSLSLVVVVVFVAEVAALGVGEGVGCGPVHVGQAWQLQSPSSWYKIDPGFCGHNRLEFKKKLKS